MAKDKKDFKIVTPKDTKKAAVCGPDGCVIDWDKLGKKK